LTSFGRFAAIAGIVCVLLALSELFAAALFRGSAANLPLASLALGSFLGALAIVALVGIPIALVSGRIGIDRSMQSMAILGGVIGAIVELAIILLTYGTPSSTFETQQLLYFTIVGSLIGATAGLVWVRLKRTDGDS
jgi:hypothetical protein